MGRLVQLERGDHPARPRRRPYPGAPTGDADAYLKPSVVAASFAPDLSRKEIAVITATRRPLTFCAGS
jgi:hypothetical protein